MLSNIVLNYLDWTLDKHGYKFIRYADDFIVLTKSLHQAEEALKVVQHCIEEDLGLQLSEEKTGITTFKQGFEFLGFFISSRTVKMKPKAEKKFRDKIKSNTTRSHNLDRTVITKLNQIIRGTVNYFYQSYTTNLKQFKRLDSWIRKRIRCMKFKRIWHTDNRRMGLLFCYDLCVAKEG